MNKRSFFSVNYSLIKINSELPYDLYVNSSSIKERQKFVRIFPMGEFLSENDLLEFKEKYLQLYVAEDQRDFYMKSLVQSEDVSDEEAMSFIKDSAIEYLHNIFDPKKEFSTELLYETINGSKDAVENMIDVLDEYDIDGLRGLIGNLSGHDFYTYDHSINVSMYCITILKVLKKDATRTELLHAGLGGLLHDLGKISIPTVILNKPNGLTEEEYHVIQTHPDLGIDLLLNNESVEIEDLDIKTIARVIHEHHEAWDGSGYPRGISEKDIHLLARICAIADFFDAITTKRSYSEVVTVSEALAIMEKTAGKKIDPKLFKLFAAHVNHTKVKSAKELKMSDAFDPSIPYSILPLEEVEALFDDKDFGKIKLIDEKNKEEEK